MSNLRKKIASISDLMAESATPQITMLECELIDCRTQVRTEFNDESIAELAEDIKTRGLQQPVKVRPLDTGRYLMIFGERRLRASRLAGIETIPAIIEDMTDNQAEDVQFMENIQREDLSLADLAAAIGRRYEQLKAEVSNPLDTIAAQVKKSKSWVSKHLAAATKLHPDVAALLHGGHTQDIELLLIINKCLETEWAAGNSLIEELEAGHSVSRKKARDTLASAGKKEEKAAPAPAPAKAATPQPKPIPEPEAVPAAQPTDTSPFVLVDMLEDLIYSDGIDVEAVIASLADSDRAQVEGHLMRCWQAGHDAAAQSKDALIGKIFESAYEGDDHLALRALLSGGMGEPFDATTIAKSTRRLLGID